MFQHKANSIAAWFTELLSKADEAKGQKGQVARQDIALVRALRLIQLINASSLGPATSVRLTWDISNYRICDYRAVFAGVSSTYSSARRRSSFILHQLPELPVLLAPVRAPWGGRLRLREGMSVKLATDSGIVSYKPICRNKGDVFGSSQSVLSRPGITLCGTRKR